MAANTSPVFEKDPHTESTSYTNSDSAATAKDLVAAASVPTEGLRIDQITLTSTETATARVIQFFTHDGTSSWLIGSVNVPINSGFDGTAPAVDAMPMLSPVLGYFVIKTGHKLQVSNVTQVASGKTVSITARGGKLTA